MSASVTGTATATTTASRRPSANAISRTTASVAMPMCSISSVDFSSAVYP